MPFQFNNTSSTDISQNINDNLVDKGDDLSGGGLKELAEIQVKMITKRRNETNADIGDSSVTFASNVLNNTDILFNIKHSWIDLNQEMEVWRTTSNLLQGIVESGSLFLTETEANSSDLEFTGNNLYTAFQTISIGPNPTAITFHGEGVFGPGQILIPSNLSLAISDRNITSIKTIGTSFFFNDTDFQKFPSHLPNGSNDSLLIPYMIDFSLVDIDINDLSDEERIEIFFSSLQSGQVDGKNIRSQKSSFFLFIVCRINMRLRVSFGS